MIVPRAHGFDCPTACYRFPVGVPHRVRVSRIRVRPLPRGDARLSAKVTLAVLAVLGPDGWECPSGAEAVLDLDVDRDGHLIPVDPLETRMRVGEATNDTALLEALLGRAGVCEFGDPAPLTGFNQVLRWWNESAFVPAPTTAPASPTFVFCIDHRNCHCRFAGAVRLEESTIPVDLGVRYYHAILRKSPGAITIAELEACKPASAPRAQRTRHASALPDAGARAMVLVQGAQEMMDDRARREVGERLRAINADIERAKAVNDTVMADIYEREKEELVKQINTSLVPFAKGVKGRRKSRSFLGGNRPTRARRAVEEALRRAREAMTNHGMPGLAAHLNDHVCCVQGSYHYSPPDPSPCWEL